MPQFSQHNSTIHSEMNVLQWEARPRTHMDLVDSHVALIPASVGPFSKLHPLFSRLLVGKKPVVLSGDDGFFVNRSKR